MAKESISEFPEVDCLFCGQRTPAPVLMGVRRSPDGEQVFRVAIIRCHRCGKEAPYPAARMLRRGETSRSKHSDAA